MFCENCGQHNTDGSAFCVNCGTPIKPLTKSQPEALLRPGTFQQTQPALQTQPIQAVQPVQAVQAVQSARPAVAPKSPKKSHKGLIIGLITGVVILIAAAVLLVMWVVPMINRRNAAPETSVVGLWSSEENAEVLKFKDSGTVSLYTYEDTLKGTYEFDAGKNEGVITIDDSDYSFTADKDEVDVEDMGIYTKVDDENFDIDAFIEDNASALETTVASTAETTLESTSAPTVTAAATTAATVETVSDLSLTLSLYFGDFTGTYTGELVNGLPNGYGTFTSTDSDGTAWVYDGQWVDGHQYGTGVTTWDSGYVESGEYKDDYLNGEGQIISDGVVYYSGTLSNSVPNGIGTLYNSHSEAIYAGSFSNGYIDESAENRSARLGAFKDQSIAPAYAELYQACQDQVSIRSQITGTVFQVYEYDSDQQYYCDFLMYEQGVEDSGRIIQVYYRLSVGEAPVTEGQSVTVWGTSEYLYTYESEDGSVLTVPHVEAFGVE